eukprot:jgi/Tetstr1/431663/TSEL_021192.t1
MAAVVTFMFFAGELTGMSCRVRDVHVDSYNITMHVYSEKGRAGRRGPDDLRVLLLPLLELPRVARLLHHYIDSIQSAPRRWPEAAYDVLPSPTLIRSMSIEKVAKMHKKMAVSNNRKAAHCERYAA